MFHPTAGGPMAYGTIGSDGGYTLRTAGSDGLIPGDYTATVVAYAKEPWEGITEEQVEQIRLVPGRYADPKTSEQEFVVVAGAANRRRLPPQTTPFFGRLGFGTHRVMVAAI
jgi:hypothetical protein